MAISLKHAFTNPKADGGDATIVRPSNWNAEHVLTQATARILGRKTAGDGATEELTPQQACEVIKAPYIFAQSGATVTAGAVVTEETLATITIPGNAMGANGWVAVAASWQMTNGANNKTMRVRIGGIAGTTVFEQVATTSSLLPRITYIINANSASSQKTFSSEFNSVGYGLVGNNVKTAAVDTTANFDIVITGQKATAGDTLTLQSYQAIICYGA